MFCLRCTKRLLAPRGSLTPSLPPRQPLQRLPNISHQSRTLFLLSNRSLRPSLTATTTTASTASSTTLETPSNLPSTATTWSSASSISNSLSALQIRGAKRDTYDPSHFVRKRRHGFLSRVRTRTGRKTLKRRQLKGRSTLSH